MNHIFNDSDIQAFSKSNLIIQDIKTKATTILQTIADMEKDLGQVIGDQVLQ